MSSLITLDANAVTEITAIQSKVLAIGERFALLTIEGPEDKAGFDRVHEARMQARDLRLDVQKRHETAKKAALEFGRKLDEAKRNIVGLIEPIEADLQAKEDAYKAAKEEIKRKAAEAAQAKLQARVDALGAVGGSASIAVLQALTDEQFAAELATATKAHEDRKAAEERDRLDREKRRADEEAKQARLQARIDLMVVYEGVSSIQALGEMTDEQFGAELDAAKARYKKRQDDKAEADRLAKEEANRLAEQRRTLDEERRKLDAEKQRLDREEFERRAKLKAEQEARDKLEAERKEQERKDAEAKAEEARREAMKPDLEKLRDYVVALEAVPIPSVSDPAVYQIVLNMTGEVERMCQRVESWIDEQAK